MGGHHKRNVRPRLFQFVRPHALCIHVYSAHFTGKIFKQSVSLLISRVFQSDPAAGPDDGTEQHHQIVIPRPYNDLIR